jgi:hypothetical protein
LDHYHQQHSKIDNKSVGNSSSLAPDTKKRKLSTASELALDMQHPEILTFAGRLTPQEADTTRYRPMPQDKANFEQARRKAEASV